ncbi:MAG: hypothetical protein WC624_04330 [Candidatus Margulisiibacteriota bacterium]
MKKGKSDQEIKDNIKWFKRFTLEKRFELAFEQIKGIKALRALIPKKHASTN